MSPLLKFTWNRFWTSVALFAWIILAYAIPNHFVLFNPMPVPQTLVDKSIPLMPAWTWVYISYYPFIYFAYYCTSNDTNARRYLRMMGGSATVAMLIFVFLPTSVMRDPIVETGFSAAALSILRGFDNSVNCLPSMHVAMSFIAAYTYAFESKRYAPPAVLWALLIAYSTMATKQHFFFDVVGGATLAAVTIAINSAAASRYLDRYLFPLRRRFGRSDL
jgi:membrane-associated phospholipid phosphatase